MQQTSKYQFNLVENTDDFSPAPLNQNMEKVEEELEGILEVIGSGGNTARIAYGSYTGTGTQGSGAAKRNSLTFDFKPLVVVIADPNSANGPVILSRGSEWTPSPSSSRTITMTWTENGVSWYGSYDAASQLNTSGSTYPYVVIGEAFAEV